MATAAARLALSVEGDENHASRWPIALIACRTSKPRLASTETCAGPMRQGADLFYKKQEPRKLFPEQKRAIDEHAARLMQGW